MSTIFVKIESAVVAEDLVTLVGSLIIPNENQLLMFDITTLDKFFVVMKSCISALGGLYQVLTSNGLL